MSPRRVGVALGARSYDVVIGAGLIADAGRAIAPIAKSGRIAVVADDTVARLHGEPFMGALRGAGLAADLVGVKPGEASKSWAELERLCGALLDLRLERGDLIAAFGGGVIGDLAGFAAAIVKRGIDFVQVPTTLLAQVDSSVGGKTAIDVAQGKNLIGAFHQPRLVLCDTDVLATLPGREIAAGYAEIVKYGLLGDAAFFAWLEANGADVRARKADALIHAISVSVAMKARIVAEDEREGGVRALLNLGHTFAHGFETETGHGAALLHGEAVALGMVAAFDLSVRAGLCPPAHAARVRAHLAAAGLPVTRAAVPGLAGAEPGRLIAHMAHDKKAEGGRLRFVLARGIGEAFVTGDVAMEDVAAVLTVL